MERRKVCTKRRGSKRKWAQNLSFGACAHAFTYVCVYVYERTGRKGEQKLCMTQYSCFCFDFFFLWGVCAVESPFKDYLQNWDI